MKNVWCTLKEIARTVNFDGLRCVIKSDPSFREMMGAFERQKEIDRDQKKTDAP